MPANNTAAVSVHTFYKTENEPDEDGLDDRVTRHGTIVGTLPFMSPEQLRSGPIDHRSDIWAVGIMLYQMVAGRHPLDPFTRKTIKRVVSVNQRRSAVWSVESQKDFEEHVRQGKCPFPESFEL